MKLEKKHYIIIGVIVAIVLIWYFFLRKKKAESSFRSACAVGFKPNPNDPSQCVPITLGIESSFGHGGGHGGGHHGGRGWGGRGWGGWGGGWGWGWPEPIVIGSSRCPEGWIWMGVVQGCVKPQGM